MKRKEVIDLLLGGLLGLGLVIYILKFPFVVVKIWEMIR